MKKKLFQIVGFFSWESWEIFHYLIMFTFKNKIDFIAFINFEEMKIFLKLFGMWGLWDTFAIQSGN